MCTLRVVSKWLNQKNRNPFIYSCEESISVEEDADAEFNVEFSGEPTPTITWHRDLIHLTEVRFNVEFSGEPTPTITWHRDLIHLTEVLRHFLKHFLVHVLYFPLKAVEVYKRVTGYGSFRLCKRISKQLASERDILH